MAWSLYPGPQTSGLAPLVLPVENMKVLLSIKPEFAFKIFDGTKRYEYRRRIFKRSSVTTIVVYTSAPIQKVIGEFKIGAVLEGAPEELWAKTKDYAGIRRDRFLQYFSNSATGYAISVAEPRLYAHHVTLSSLGIARAPQSFVYLS